MNPNLRAWLLFTVLMVFAIAAMVFALVVNPGQTV